MSPADDQTRPEEDAGPPLRFASPEEEAAYHKAVGEGLADAEAGRLVPMDAVKAWIASWDTPDELPMPECG